MTKPYTVLTRYMWQSDNPPIQPTKTPIKDLKITGRPTRVSDRAGTNEEEIVGFQQQLLTGERKMSVLDPC